MVGGHLGKVIGEVNMEQLGTVGSVLKLQSSGINQLGNGERGGISQ
jgi:hypothetical protein